MPPIDDLAVIGGRWTLPILILLLDGPMRFNDLRRGLPGISAKLLTTRLRELHNAGLLEHGFLTLTVAILAYSLAPRIDSLRPALKLLRERKGTQPASAIEHR